MVYYNMNTYYGEFKRFFKEAEMSVWYSVVVPVYNEEEVVKECLERLTTVMSSQGEEYELIFVDDGSRDKTLEILESYAQDDNKIKILSFSRNFGHQAAISAGMDFSSGKAIIIIDADLQDPPEIIPEMIKKWKEGFDVVYGKREKRKGESAFKKTTAKLFYRFLASQTELDIPVDTGDFRLIDRKVCDVLSSLTEKNRYVRGLVSFAGFRQTGVSYVRDERFAGETKYPLKMMLKFAMDATTSFSKKPLKIAGIVGSVLSVASFLYLFYAIYLKLFTDQTVSGWASIVSIMLFFNGVMLIILGIMGEYIGRIYDEVKNRPLYIIKDKTGFSDGEDKYGVT